MRGCVSEDSADGKVGAAEQQAAAAPTSSTGRGATAARVPKRADGSKPAPGRRNRAEKPLWRSIVVNLLIMLAVVSLVQNFLVRVHNVSSGSMQQTLAVTDRVLSSQLPYLGSHPQRSDIIIFAHGETWDSPRRPPDPNPAKQALRWFGDVTGIGISDYLYTVKRVIGVEGDTVACCTTEGQVTVNGQAISEPYIYQDPPFTAGVLDCATKPRSNRCFAPIAVPAGTLLVMGDHRSDSADSVWACRSEVAPADCAKFVTVTQVTGKVIARAWPPGPVS